MVFDIQPGVALFPANSSNKPHTYGYHNTFSTHAAALPPSDPPRYDQAVSSRSLGSCSHAPETGSNDVLPGYSPGVHREGWLAVQTEMTSPFLTNAHDWHDVYVVLQGTQLSLYRPKTRLFKSRTRKKGRLQRTYSLQHAEVGVAVDWRKTPPTSKVPFVKVLPRAAQLKLFESDPELFEPIREFVFRVRLEKEQMIFCATSHGEMLDYVEDVGIGIDIAPPLDDRSEPRYRSLPRRTRRQRQIEAAAQISSHPEARQEAEQRFIEEQERLFKRMYPHLANSSPSASSEQVATQEQTEVRHELERETTQEADGEDFDPADARGEAADVLPVEEEEQESRSPSAQSGESAAQSNMQDEEEEAAGDEAINYDPKTIASHPPLSQSALCRFRRRCAPILLASSPRASHVIFSNGLRYQIDFKRFQLTPFEQRPPRYDSSSKHAAFTVASQALEVLGEIPASPPSASPSPSSSSSPELLHRRPSMSRGVSEATSTSTWGDRSVETEILDEDALSLHVTISRANGSREELGSIDTVQSVEDGEAAIALIGGRKSMEKIKGKGKAVLVAVTKRQESHYGDAALMIAHAPLLI